jgi:ribonuclease P protein component
MAEYRSLKKRRDFLRAARDISITGRHVIIQATRCFEKDVCGLPLIGFTATKRLGKAYYRNLTKRRLRAVCRETAQKRFFRNVDYVLVGRRDTAVCNYKELKNEVLFLLRKVNFLLSKKENDSKIDKKNICPAD